jgi:D-alanyl-D-alanine carboxypeptidase/D-alanyl-D-alanine-endopeptidase (penicillin-binding protein 4)
MSAPMTRRTAAMVAILALPVACPQVASASLGGRVGTIVSHSRFAGPGTGVAVYDQTARRWIYQRRALSELRPASNMKLTTAAVALADLGAGARLHTTVYRTGVLSGGTLTGSLWLVGGGDPSFSTGVFARHAYNGAGSHVSDLAAAIRAAGIRRVTGRVWGVESLFDSVRTGPFWKASYWRDCPPISALSVNRDLVSFYKPYSYHQPATRAAEALRLSLQSHGVRVGHDSRTSTLPGGATPVASVRSPRIARLVRLMDQPSDNFFAEVLNKRVAVAAGKAGTMRNGRREARRYLTSLGINLTGAKLYDGSGLSLGDRLSARQILAVLRRASAQSWAGSFRGSLPLAGVSGTLSDRMRSGPAFHNARAKTGTLDSASALSGYVTTANGHTIVFSILMNRRSINVAAAHAVQDKIVQTLASGRPR